MIYLAIGIYFAGLIVWLVLVKKDIGLPSELSYDPTLLALTTIVWPMIVAVWIAGGIFWFIGELIKMFLELD